MTVHLQSMLFVPGSRPDRFAKALASGADCVCIDLEDSVAADGKDQARADALAALAELQDARLAIRINALTTRAGLADLLALAAAVVRPALVYLPMVEAAAELDIAARVLDDTGVGLVPLIETVAGLRAADAIAAHPSCAMLMFGGGDFSAQLGTELAWEPLVHARAALVMAAAGAGKPVMDVPWIALDDMAGLADECRRAKALGFTAKAAIAPAQIAVLHDVFRPTAPEVAAARAALAAFEAAGRVAVRHDGRMLELPVIRKYERILAVMAAVEGKQHA